MLASSSRVAGRSSQPRAPIRSGELPTMYTTFTATRCVNMSRYCSTVDQRPGSGGLPSRPELICTNRRKSSCEWNGAYELPSTPISSVVMPWRTFGSCCGSARITSPECACMSMKPGQTTCPVASMRRRASMPLVSPRRMRTRSSSTATSPKKPGLPVPSMTKPPPMSRSSIEVSRQASFVIGEGSSGARAWPDMPRGYADRSNWSTGLMAMGVFDLEAASRPFHNCATPPHPRRLHGPHPSRHQRSDRRERTDRV